MDESHTPVWTRLNDEGLAGMTVLGRHLLDTGQLRPGIDLAEVRDVLWNYLAIVSYERLGPDPRLVIGAVRGVAQPGDHRRALPALTGRRCHG